MISDEPCFLISIEIKNAAVDDALVHQNKPVRKIYVIAVIDQEHIPLSLKSISAVDEDEFMQAQNIVMAFRVNYKYGASKLSIRTIYII